MPTSGNTEAASDLLLKVVRPTWRGLENITNIVIFGDSYSYEPSQSAVESDEAGEAAWKKGEASTWPGFLADKLRASLSDPPLNPLRIYNYAVPGDTVEDDLENQLAVFRSRLATTKLEPEKTLYIIWLGINDCGGTLEDEQDEVMEKLSDTLHALYVQSNARNFLLMDVPPMDRCPGGQSLAPSLARRCTAWNALLQSSAEMFAADTKHATVFLFSMHAVISDILDNPESFGFSGDELEEQGGPIWEDLLHLRSEVHAVMAERVICTLSAAGSAAL